MRSNIIYAEAENETDLGQKELKALGHASVGVEGVEKKLREERRRLLKEKELIEGKYPRIKLPEEIDEEEAPNVNLAEDERKLSKMAGKWSQKMDKVPQTYLC